MKITVTREFELTNGEIDDLVSCALEGGITYWCGQAKVYKEPINYDYDFISDIISHDGELILYDAETPETWILTKEKFIKGFIKYTEERGISPEQLVEDYDADDADSIIQYALFDEIVFA
jgi:hypothetical protein